MHFHVCPFFLTASEFESLPHLCPPISSWNWYQLDLTQKWYVLSMSVLFDLGRWLVGWSRIIKVKDSDSPRYIITFFTFIVTKFLKVQMFPNYVSKYCFQVELHRCFEFFVMNHDSWFLKCKKRSGTFVMEHSKILFTSLNRLSQSRSRTISYRLS